jgi:fused signal recognition particle receptor
VRFFSKKKDATEPDKTEPESAEEQKPAQEENEEKSGGLFGKLKSGLKKTQERIAGGLRAVLTVGRSLDEELIEEIEEQLYVADVGPRAVMRLCDQLRDAYKKGEITKAEEVLPFLKDQIKEELGHWNTELHLPENELGVVLVAGVNGSGKTTTIGKLAHRFRQQGQKVLLAASDTFRAAAVEQLSIWAEQAGADIVKNESADPAAVAFDAVDKGTSGDYDVLIVDTAGRVHTRRNLMQELEKISRVIAKKAPGAPHETLLVLDATTGQNGISQALRFNETLDVTGIILAKLDGTAKGGIVFGMRDQIDIPVKFVGVGQQEEDLAPFDPDDFVEALFA